MNRSLPDVEVREEGTSHRGNIMYKTPASLPGAGVGRGGEDAFRTQGHES